MINITINNQKLQSYEGQMILHVAQDAGIFIPTLCHSDGFIAQGSCGICIVEVAGSGQLVRACATPVAQGMEVNTHSARVTNARKRLLELQLSTHSGDCKAPCQLACPAQTDCQGYITLIAQGQYHEATRLMLEAHPFPASIARVCPRPCEKNCRRGMNGEPVNIAGLKRFAADMKISDYMPKIKPDTAQTIAIIGGGPAGLTAAYFLRRAGHEVDVYEYMPKMGGLLRYGIPEYRLPKAVLDKEINLLSRMGIKFHNGIKLVSSDVAKHDNNRPESARHISLAHLQKTYDAVIVAVGAGGSHPMGVPGEDLPCVIGGIDFLKKVSCDIARPDDINANTSVIDTEICVKDKNIAVIGGSNTAIDAARTAIRLGASIVTVIYRRTRYEMPADPAEISEAIEEGVNFIFLAAPIEITQNSIRLQMMTLGEPEADGRLVPKVIPGQEKWHKADIIITAIGQTVVPCGLENLKKTQSAIYASPGTFQTSQLGVYAIGDVTKQSAYAIEAIGHGRKVAAVVHDFLQGKSSNMSHTYPPPWEITPSIVVTDEPPPSSISCPPRENPIKKEATNGFEEIHQGLTPAQAASEASRCLSCGCKGYSNCKLLKLANQYDVNPKKYPTYKNANTHINQGQQPTRNPNKCILCGLCIHACAQDKAILTMANRGFKVHVAAFPQANCARCGNCAKVCPVGACTHD